MDFLESQKGQPFLSDSNSYLYSFHYKRETDDAKWWICLECRKLVV